MPITRSKLYRLRLLSRWNKGKRKASRRPRADKALPAEENGKAATKLRKLDADCGARVTPEAAAESRPRRVSVASEGAEPRKQPPPSPSLKGKSWFLALSPSGARLTAHKQSKGTKPAPPRSPRVRPSPRISPRLRPVAPPKRLDVHREVQRILAAASPEELLEVRDFHDEKAIESAWKKLVLLLHPDKLQRLSEAEKIAGAEALHKVHEAKEELRRRQQELQAEVPAQPEAAAAPRCMEATAGLRKFEISWQIPEKQDPRAPVERYEIWGPKYFSDMGDPFDWTLLATLPNLQSHFVLVEEAPTQQDVMWAADRVLRPTLPLTVHAVNGKGSSEALTFELPWSTAFPWLRGTPAVLCDHCFQLLPQRGHWTKCGSCGLSVSGDNVLVLKCPDCRGEVLWQGNTLGCCCCQRKFGQARAPRPPQGHRHRGGGSRPW